MRRLLFLTPTLALASFLACSSTVQSSGGGGSSSTTASGTTTTTGSSTSSSSSGGTGGAQPCSAPPAPQPYQIGTGEACFERLSAQQVVPVMQGPQGGYHLWLAIGCGDCGPKATLSYGVKDPATGTWFAGTGELKQVVDLNADSWRQRAGLTAFLPGIVWDPMSSLPKGTHVILTASVLDEAMAAVHAAEVEVVLGDVMMWSPPCDPGPGCGAPGGLPCCTDGFGDAGIK